MPLCTSIAYFCQDFVRIFRNNVQYHAHNKMTLHSKMPRLIIIYHWWIPSWYSWVLGEAWKMPVCLTTSPSQSQQQGPVELLEAGAGTLKETVGGIIFFTLEIHCYNLNLWYRYCETGSHFNGTIRSHKSQAGYLASCGSFKWPTHSTTDKYICLWTRT